MSKDNLTIKYKPFLRWAGGKTWLTKKIVDYLPKEINNYHEPFLGGGAIFIHLKSHQLINGKSYLSDANKELINSYQQLKCEPEIIVKKLKGLKNTEEDYYKIRSTKPYKELNQAVRFIYLNKTSFNGLYRVNKNGQYNVPYGYKKSKKLYDYENLINVSSLLDKTVSMTTSDFNNCIDNVEKGDLIFLDPPYTVAHDNNGFIQYNQKIFSWADQERLLSLIKEIETKGAYYILTNAAHFSIKDLFSTIGKRYKIDRSSTIGGKGATRAKVNEYIFSNIQL
ncbi:MAG: Dam family site-specific DNA-(adenine-N6)-methyltransferase [Bacteroidales bacterium]|jgi:DNA adenine methylase|nr:Dam family site-specific DNA-(adenine-N6)-methyltransferase [Bacteroidales bacterium]